MTEYIKLEGKKAKKTKEVDDEMAAVQVNRPLAGVITVIHGIIERSAAARNYLRSRLTRACFWSQAHPIVEVMFVMAPKRNRESNLLYELTFTEEDLVGVDVPHNDVLVLMVNIYNYDVMRVLIDPGSLLEVMYLNLSDKLKHFIPKKNVRTINAPIYSFSGEPI